MYEPIFPNKHLDVKSTFYHRLSDEELEKNDVREWYAYSRIMERGILSWIVNTEPRHEKNHIAQYTKMMKNM